MPLARALADGPVELPPAKAPSLEDLAVRVPAAEDLTEGDFLRRFQELSREAAKSRDRAEGEAVAMGDDAQLDAVGYSEGKLIPFSVRTGMWMVLQPEALLPGFAEGIVGTKVGESAEVELELPADYPVEGLRGKKAHFIVDVLSAREVKMPESEGPALLKALGRGSSLDEVMDSIAEELEEELADQLWVQAQDLVLDELVERAKPQVPIELVDEEVRRRWGQVEGKALGEKQFDVKEQEEALAGWLEDRETRADAERRLKISLVLKAIAERDQLVLTSETMDRLLEEVSQDFGLDPEEAKAAVREDTLAAKQVHDFAWHLMVVQHVMEQAKVQFEGAEDE
ncbi:MAG: FKBP-type peptidyl-prolyl cis-trans isomerase [Myxococcales bacterium]|nr:FKBP-type peptidyl-prolyl cis-trans isomerase [Myxococcales bacterium]